MNRKELLLNAALKLFVEHGFHGTATAKIAKEAGVANGTLFQYFKTKEDLIVALFIEIKKELAEFTNQKVALAKSTKEEFKAQIEATIFWAMESPAKFHFVQQMHTSPYIHQVGNEQLQAQMRAHYALIEKGVAEGLVKELPTDLLYALISNQTFGLYQFLITNKYSLTKQTDILNSTFDMLWDMISKK